MGRKFDKKAYLSAHSISKYIVITCDSSSMISEAAASVYYLFIGKATAWTSGTTTGNDSSPPTPADSVGESEYYAWDSMLAAKKIASTDITFAIPRRNWSNGTTFDMYKHNIS